MADLAADRPGRRVSRVEIRVFGFVILLFAAILGALLLWRPGTLLGAAVLLIVGWFASLLGNPGHRRTPLWGTGLPVLIGGLGVAAASGIDPRWLAAAVGLGGGSLAALVLVSTDAGQAVRDVWMRATEPMGWTMSGLVLAITYFVVLTPIGLLLRVFRRDSLGRRFDLAAPSYWSARTNETQLPRYFRQF